MKAFWDQRYRSKGYAYGGLPKVWLRSRVEVLAPGKILLPTDGEGRNAV
ncbi:MAG: hypothetical protein ACK5VH_10645 [bacterium]|jgi:hypothetical protein|nr:hypothetical protein [Chitinophagaceae bacterium]